MPQWVVVGLETSVAWPVTETKVRYRGHEIILRPSSERHAPTVVISYDLPTTFDQALVIVRQFLSSLSWAEGMPIRETLVTGGGLPIHVGREPLVNHINPTFRADYLPEPNNPKTLLALAFYREALAVNSVAYQFLGFFKILNIVHSTWKAQADWINATLDKLTDFQALERLKALKAEQTDIGQYLYVSGRCAVAHAFNEPLVNPEDPEDTVRLSRDLPLIRALAAHLIEHELGVKSKHTVWREHLYELDGFRSLLGNALLQRLNAKEPIQVGEVPQFPPLSVRLRDQPTMSAFEGLEPTVLDANEGRILLRCSLPSGLVQMLLGLNFAAERLEHDPLEAVSLTDNGSEEAAQYALDHIRLIRGLVLNGQLEVWDSTREMLLGRCDPCIPVNIDLSRSVQNLDFKAQQIETEIASRRAAIPDPA